MNGQMRDSLYFKTLQNMCGPYTKSNIPQISLDLRGMVSLAKKLGKTVPELTDDEIKPFVLNASVSELKNSKIKL